MGINNTTMHRWTSVNIRMLGDTFPLLFQPILSSKHGSRGKRNRNIKSANTVEPETIPTADVGSVFALDDKLNLNSVLCSDGATVFCFTCLHQYYCICFSLFIRIGAV